jgi:hypothetical protein
MSIYLDENDDEKLYLYQAFLVASKIDENVVVFSTWKVVHMPLDTL